MEAMAMATSQKQIWCYCSVDIQERAKSMVMTRDSHLSNREWKMVKDMHGLAIGSKMELALVYKHLFAGMPEGFWSLKQSVATVGTSGELLYQGYKSQASEAGRSLYLKGVHPANIPALCYEIVKDVKTPLYLVQLLELLNLLNNMKPSHDDQLATLVSNSSIEEEQCETYDDHWISECIKISNTLDCVIEPLLKAKPVSSAVTAIHDANRELHRLVKSIGNAEQSYDKNIIYMGWIDAMLSIANSPDYLNLKGIAYSVIKNSFDRLNAIRSSL
uniref:M protein n=1 Tax=Varroa orthomyxovirus-1 TaxID=2510845 RepID=A0A8K1QWD5_9ORTO|nr:MAG: M protein [Varroa orthomyxovirus-1]UDY81346.1 MAG: M protein [Varroa orthomyxovirus-1]